MAETTINTGTCKLFPSPRNAHRQVFLDEILVPHPYAPIDLPSLDLASCLHQRTGNPMALASNDIDAVETTAGEAMLDRFELQRTAQGDVGDFRRGRDAEP